MEANVPPALDVHVVMDNYATRKHAKARAWFAQRPRFHVHFTPMNAFWLIQIGRWFGIIGHSAIKRGTFRNVKQLIDRIQPFVGQYNAQSAPFAWTATADSILQKVARLSKLLRGTAHLAHLLVAAV